MKNINLQTICHMAFSLSLIFLIRSLPLAEMRDHCYFKINQIFQRNETNPTKKLKYSCCFCASGVKNDVAALLAISNYDKPENEQFTQQFFFHFPCLLKKLNPSARDTEQLDINADTYECCFCAKYIEKELATLVTISHWEQPREEQGFRQFYFHIPCLKKQLSSESEKFYALDLDLKAEVCDSQNFQP